MTDDVWATNPTLLERLRWNADNSHNASRLNMGIDQMAAVAEIERLRAALTETLAFLQNPEWGTVRYMEGSSVYEDKDAAISRIVSVLAGEAQ